MGENRWTVPTRWFRWLLAAAGWMAPAANRAEWRRHWINSAEAWWILAERGELIGQEDFALAAVCRGAWANAFWLRFSRSHLMQFLRGPWIVLVGLAASLSLVGFLSGGFRVARLLLHTAVHVSFAKPHDFERLLLHCVALAFAAAVSLAVYLAGHRTLPRGSWRYWGYFTVKSAILTALVVALWMEGGAAIRSHIEWEGLRVFVFGLLLTFAFIVVCGFAAAWSFADQRGRCPVCLQCLALPVSLGSWSSIFDPPATEMVCEKGHGALCIPDLQTIGSEHWTPLGNSWQDLFEHSS
jgi:hypothetical protein